MHRSCCRCALALSIGALSAAVCASASRPATGGGAGGPARGGPQEGAESSLTVSYVDTSRSRYDRLVLMVDGRPFHYRGAQVRADTMRLNLGWSDDAIADAIARMRRDGFTVANIILFWRDVEPRRDSFDWTKLDRFIEWCEKAGIKMEIVWFGSDSTGYSFGDGVNMNRIPDYAKSEFAFVTHPDGREVITPTHRRKLLDKTDPALLARERLVIARMMEHVADRNARTGDRRTVIGIQLLNEAYVSSVRDGASTATRLDRSYSRHANARWAAGGYTDAARFRNDVLLSYLQGLAEEVKRSRYVIWTRHNPIGDARPVAENERARETVGTPLDFIGFDPYTGDVEVLYKYGSDPFWAQGRNFPMIMENYAGGEGIEYATLSSIAGGAVVNHYSLVESESATDTTGYPGVYGKDPVAKRAVDSVDTAKHRAINTLLGKLWFDLATRATPTASRDSLVFFNPRGARSCDEGKPVGGRTLRFVSSIGGVGVAVARGPRELALGAFRGGTFVLPPELVPTSATRGYYDAENTWVREADRGLPAGSGAASFELAAGEVIRVLVR